MEENDQLRFEGFNLTNKELGTKRGLITDALTKDKLIDLYFHQNKSLQDIAKEYNCTRQMIKLLMEKYGLQRRKRSEARILAIKKGKFERFKYYDINESFFKSWTPAMAWVLGLLFTDGCLCKSSTGGFRVSISSIDYELLEKIARHLNSTKTIIQGTQSYDKSKYIYRFEFSREKMIEDLSNLKLIERKSLIMQFPDVPDKFMRHFIRGCWDGDGTVYLIGGVRIGAQYVSGSLAFIERLVEELYKEGIYREKILAYERIEKIKRLRSIYPDGKYPIKIHRDNRSKSSSYLLKLSSRENIERLFHYFYDDLDESMYLKRKYDMFVKGLNISKQEIQKHKEEMQRHYREVSCEYSAISLRNVIQDVEKLQKKKVLTIDNANRYIKCIRCGVMPETLYLINQPYCPSCFISCFSKRRE